VRDVLADIGGRHPGFEPRLLNEAGELHKFVNVFVDGENVRVLDGLNTAVEDASEISIIPAVAGGSLDPESVWFERGPWDTGISYRKDLIKRLTRLEVVVAGTPTRLAAVREALLEIEYLEAECSRLESIHGQQPVSRGDSTVSRSGSQQVVGADSSPWLDRWTVSTAR
jgi:molybdopterin converting factor small subunit